MEYKIIQKICILPFPPAVRVNRVNYGTLLMHFGLLYNMEQIDPNLIENKISSLSFPLDVFMPFVNGLWLRVKKTQL